MTDEKIPEWITRGKTIRGLIKELQSFENQDLEVKISTDGGETFQTISLVGKYDDICGLTHYDS